MSGEIKWVRRLSQDNQIKQRRAWLLLGQVTAERSCRCKRPARACPAIGGGSEVTFKPLVPRLSVREGFLALTSPGSDPPAEQDISLQELSCKLPTNVLSCHMEQHCRLQVIHSDWPPTSSRAAADCYISCSKLGIASSLSTASSGSSTRSLVNLTGGVFLFSRLPHLTSRQNNAHKPYLCQTPTTNRIKAISPSTD
ncbi:hypothetical protein J6590_016035 [Homalodisca vitripennis]|nr:hypothetical protein J6590_016035 [Homalodisca vitripennis]